MTTRRHPAIAVALLTALAGAVAMAQAPAGPAPKKNPLVKLAQPWPDEAQMKKQKLDSESLPLFGSHDTVEVTLAADFKDVNKDRDANSAKRYPAELRFAKADGSIEVVPVKLGARGHLRRNIRTCDYVPLRVELPKDRLKGTMFEGQNVLKLVVQCRGGDDYGQFIVREYLAYRVFNLLTPRSFRARLAKVSYVDSATGKPSGTRYGMWLEDDSDVAKRMEGRTVDLQRLQFKDLDTDMLDTMMVFHYMIGSTDFSIYALHNVQLVQTPDRMFHSIPYDFDMTGLVHPPYAVPDRRLPIKSVEDRMYRGPCRTLEQIEPIVANFNAKRELVLALTDDVPDLTADNRRTAKNYLTSFYASVKDSKDVKRTFVDGCSKASTM